MAETSLTAPERLGALLSWLGATLGADDLRLVEAPRAAANGSSNETAMLRCAWTGPGGTPVERGLVARTAPRADGLFHHYDLERQYRTMAALAHTDVPVPRLVGYGDAAVLGEDFYVMEAAPGEAPPDLPPYTTTGWLFEAEPADQRLVHDRTLDVIARIHRLDVASLDLGFLVDSAPGRGLEDQLVRAEAWFRWAAAGRAQPTMDLVLSWLREHVPAARAPDGLNWGDARFGNVLYEDLRPTCVLDWEMAALGPAEVDMGWWWFMNRFYAEGSGAPPLPGMPSEPEARRHYERALGRSVHDLLYYEVLAGFRFGIVFMRAAQRIPRPDGDPPPPMERINPVTGMLARMLDLPPPS